LLVLGEEVEFDSGDIDECSLDSGIEIMNHLTPEMRQRWRGAVNTTMPITNIPFGMQIIFLVQ
jgi:hypothetical protein